MKSVAWVYDSVLVLMSAAIGFFLGLAGLGMVELILKGAWATVIMLIVFSLSLAVIVIVHQRFGLFLTGVTVGTQKVIKAERRRKRNGWIGFFFGVAVAMIASMFFPVEQIMGFF